MLQGLLKNKKTTGLVLIGLAAFAYYRFSKMTEEEKDSLVSSVTNTGKKLLGQIMQDGSGADLASKVVNENPVS